MDISELFDRILTEPTTVTMDRSYAESCRVMLSKKFARYKEQMDSVGYLDPHYKKAVVKFSYNKDNGAASFSIGPRRPPRQFEILDHETSNPA